MPSKIDKEALKIQAALQHEIQARVMEGTLSKKMAEGMVVETQVTRLVPGRKFVADVVIRSAGVVVEADGGTWTGGAHSRPAGILRDHERDLSFAECGYLTIRAGTGVADPAWARRVINIALARTVVDAFGGDKIVISRSV